MPRRPSSTKLPFARGLRREMTIAETILWRALRDSQLGGYKFRRQVPVGRYVADFLCVDHKFIVELDGAPHDRAEQQAHGAARDAWLRAQGYRVFRLPNDVVIGGGNIALDMIREALAHPSPAK